MDAKITLKIHIKSHKNNPDMFRNTKEPSSGGEYLCLAKVTCGSMVLVHGNSVSIVVAYTGCNRRNGPHFGRVFLRSYYTDITQNTYIQSSMVTEILAREV